MLEPTVYSIENWQIYFAAMAFVATIMTTFISGYFLGYAHGSHARNRAPYP
jgi:hypothetical protein